MKKLEKIYKLRKHPKNPRIIKDAKYKKLLTSLKEFPEMMEQRPLIVNNDLEVLGGNMRLIAARESGLKEVWIDKVDWSEDKQKEFMIKDNSSYGEWDWDVLANEWEVDDLEQWGVNVPTIKNTELLSKLEYNPVYYEPENNPEIKLEDCIDLDKYNAKLQALEDFDLTKKQKQLLKMFAYRFIKIDFENVANYYHYNATEKEQKAIERLRLVLTDNGIGGFIEDDLLQIMGITEDNIKDND
tara:strand:- start:894 stop:1619 length:726 start_codon:yes stop_codon:yes gene_type:complete